MDAPISKADIRDAATLIGKALTVRAHTGTDARYGELLARWQGSVRFQEIVAEIGAGLGLRVVRDMPVMEGTQLILRPDGPDSPYVALPGDLTDPQHELRRGEFAIILAGVAAAYFRTASDLVTPQDDDVRLTPSMVARIVRGICARAGEAEDGPPMRSAPLLMEGWRRIRAKPEILPDEKRANRSSLHGLVKLAMSRLAAHDMLVTTEIDGKTFYLATPRFRSQLKDVLKDRIFRELTSLVAAIPSDMAPEQEQPDA